MTIRVFKPLIQKACYYFRVLLSLILTAYNKQHINPLKHCYYSASEGFLFYNTCNKRN